MKALLAALNMRKLPGYLGWGEKKGFRKECRMVMISNSYRELSAAYPRGVHVSILTR